MATKLGLYQLALLHLGEPQLASLSENRAPRRHLDVAWDNGAMKFCLEKGQWKFAMRSREYTYSPSVTPGFGLEYGFDIPEDLVLLCGVFSDAGMTNPYRNYRVESGFWYSDIDTLFIRYVSNDEQYGGDLSLWPESFSEYVAAHLAFKTAVPITGSTDKRDDMFGLADKKLLPAALARDAFSEPTRMVQTGSWVRSRLGGGDTGREHGWRR
jgi:hypothetical protein